MIDFESVSRVLKNTTCSEVGKGGLSIWIGFGDKIKVRDKKSICTTLSFNLRGDFCKTRALF